MSLISRMEEDLSIFTFYYQGLCQVMQHDMTTVSHQGISNVLALLQVNLI